MMFEFGLCDCFGINVMYLIRIFVHDNSYCALIKYSRVINGNRYLVYWADSDFMSLLLGNIICVNDNRCTFQKIAKCFDYHNLFADLKNI